MTQKQKAIVRENAAHFLEVHLETVLEMEKERPAHSTCLK
jgi:DNA-binding XRE family transcriptional regulator